MSYISTIFNYINLNNISRLCLSLFRPINLWFLRNYDGRNLDNCDVILVLKAKHDTNGALSVPQPLNTYRLHSHKNCHIVYKEVSSLDDVTDAISELKARSNRIKGLWFHAHGLPYGFKLEQKAPISNCHFASGTFRLGNGNAYKLKDAFEMLEKDASIILESCLTGHIDETGNRSIAQTIATLAPGRLVYAPTKILRTIGMHFTWQNDALKPTFMTEKVSQRQGILGSITNVFYKVLFSASLGTYGTSMTAVYRSYTK